MSLTDARHLPLWQVPGGGPSPQFTRSAGQPLLRAQTVLVKAAKREVAAPTPDTFADLPRCSSGLNCSPGHGAAHALVLGGECPTRDHSRAHQCSDLRINSGHDFLLVSREDSEHLLQTSALTQLGPAFIRGSLGYLTDVEGAPGSGTADWLGDETRQGYSPRLHR